MMKKYSQINRLLQAKSLILASGSPRRVDLLNQAGIEFRQIIADVEENNHRDLPPYDYAVLNARKKASAVMDQASKNDIVLGCDTIVVLDGTILEKPTSQDDAVRMLKQLSGRMHTVCSAVALMTKSGRSASGFELTDVYFLNRTEDEIRDYVETGEPLDKAGAYGIQEKGVFLVDRVVGNIDNVIGLPMTLLDEMAGKLLK